MNINTSFICSWSYKLRDMATLRRKCISNPDHFCYICGSYTVPRNWRNITDLVKRLYLAYFKMKLGDQDKVWAPHIVCETCLANLRSCSRSKRKKRVTLRNSHDMGRAEKPYRWLLFLFNWYKRIQLEKQSPYKASKWCVIVNTTSPPQRGNTNSK